MEKKVILTKKELKEVLIKAANISCQHSEDTQLEKIMEELKVYDDSIHTSRSEVEEFINELNQ